MTKNIEHTLSHVQASCEKQGIKLTKKREQVLVAIVSSSNALSAYEVAEVYRNLYQASIPAMSVYRILDFFAEHSLVHKLSSANKYIACSHMVCDHQHQVPQFLICEVCHSVTEIGVNQGVMKELTDSVAKTGFSLKHQQLELIGICKNCQQ